MSESPDLIECDRHGTSEAAFVCQHVASGSGLGWFVATDDPDETRPDAWCAACEAVSNAAGGWDEESERAAGITMLCTSCYDEARARNQDVPVP